MEKTNHVMIVGDGAEALCGGGGFEEMNLLYRALAKDLAGVESGVFDELATGN